MLQEVFYWIFNMSITAAITGTMVLLLRKIKAIPRRVSVFLWAIPFLRMAVPFGVNSAYSLMGLLSGVTTKTVTVYQPVTDISVSMLNSVMAADTYFPITYKVNIVEDIFRFGSVIWSLVALAIVLMLAVTYIITIREVNDVKHWKERIYFSEKVLSPAVYGIFKPKIVLPVSFQDRDIEFVILHEKTHIQSGDNLWRIIAFLIAAVHWFNPLSWVFLKCFLSDLELACDERVLTKVGTEQAKDYALSLLECQQGFTVFTSAFGGAKIRTRIENILSFRKLTRLSLCVFTLLLSIIFYVLLTNGS